MDSPYRPVSKIATAETFTDIPEEGEAAATVRPVRSLTNSSRGSSGRGSSTGGDLRETAMAGTIEKKDPEEAVVRKKETEEEVERGNWGNQIEFVLTCVSYAVGLGNVWRFPYLCYKNGGGAFLVPYIIMLSIAGLPIFFMEMAFGQFASLGPISIWRCCPLMKGLGYGMVTVSTYICIYFAVLISYILFYFCASFTSDLPWIHCNNTWNSENCLIRAHHFAGDNATGHNDAEVAKFTTPTEEYFFRNVLNLSEGIDDLGLPEWRLTLLLLICWTLTCLGLIKGVQSLGKVSYFTAIFPYILITTLVIRGSMLEGAGDGILFYITPRWEKLREPQVWADAAIQIFYSLGPCMGTLITMSSYNKFNNNCLKNAITVALINCCTSIYGGFAIFSVVGFMARQAAAPIEKVASAGPGLAFVVYPEGLAMMPVAPLWSVLFFFMMLTIGMGSLLSQLETVISAVQDEWPVLRARGTMFRIGVCLTGFLVGLPQVCRGGFYLLNIFDNFTGGVNLLILGFVEIFTINYIYGYEKFAEDIAMMLGKRPNYYWKFCWKGVSLVAVAGILLFLCIMYAPPKCGDYVYPDWAINLGWVLCLSSIIWLPLLFIKVYCVRTGMWQEIEALSNPEDAWGPAEECNRSGRYICHDDDDVDENEEKEDDETGRNKFKTPRYAMSLFPMTSGHGQPLDVKFVSPAKSRQNEIHREDSAVSSFAPMSSIHSSTRLVKE